MTFRDDRDAQKHRIDALEDELEEAREEAAKLRQERDAALAAPKPSSTRFPRGSHVWVEWNGKWWRATVKQAHSDRLFEIHYDGWSNKWDEAVGPERIAPAHEPAPGPVATSGSGGAAFAVVAFLVIGVGVLVYWWIDAYL